MTDSSRDLFSGFDRTESNLICGSELRLEFALEQAAKALFKSQSAVGCWSPTVFGSVRATAEYVLLCNVLKQLDPPADSDSSRSPEDDGAAQDLWGTMDVPRDTIGQAAAYIASQQSPTGGWTGATDCFDLNTTTLAYLALRVSEHHPDSAHVEQAKAAILSAGGLFASDPFVHYWYAIMGEVSYNQCRPLPIELSLLSHHIPGSIRRGHPFRRVLLTTIGILAATRPSCAGVGVLTDERSPGNAIPFSPAAPAQSAALSWADRILKWWPQRTPSDQIERRSPIRKHAIAMARQWLCSQVDATAGVGGDVTATIWTTLGLIASADPAVPETIDAMKACLLFLETACASEGSFTICGLGKADVRTTAVACQALGATGMSMANLPMQRSVDWLLGRESHRSMATLSPSEVSGWSAHGGDAHFVDAETTAIVLLALREQFTEAPLQIGRTEDSMVAIIRASSTTLARRQIALLDRMAAASRRSRRWLSKIQNADGGWGRYAAGGGQRPRRLQRWSSRDWARGLIDSDTSSPLVTSLVIEALSSWDQRHEIDLRKAIGYLRSTQQAAGCWTDDGASIHPTARVIQGLIAAGLSNEDPAIANGVAWLTSQQLKSGGWRETLASQRFVGHDSSNGAEPTSPILTIFPPPNVSSQPAPLAPATSKSVSFELVSVMQTSSAILALIAAGVGRSLVVERGIGFLQQHQQPDGGWGVDEFAGNYRGCCERGYDPTSALAYPILALAAWNRRATPNAR